MILAFSLPPLHIISPQFEVEQVPEVELASPQVLAQPTQVGLPEGGSLEQHLVLAVIDTDDHSILPEILSLEAYYTVPDSVKFGHSGQVDESVS